MVGFFKHGGGLDSMPSLNHLFTGDCDMISKIYYLLQKL